MLLCPSIALMVSTSAPLLPKLVANVCLSLCGVSLMRDGYFFTVGVFLVLSGAVHKRSSAIAGDLFAFSVNLTEIIVVIRAVL